MISRFRYPIPIFLGVLSALWARVALAKRNLLLLPEKLEKAGSRTAAESGRKGGADIAAGVIARGWDMQKKGAELLKAGGGG
jgi:hypothetical protein